MELALWGEQLKRIVAAIAAAIILTACSGDDDPQVSTEPTSESAAAPETTEAAPPDVEEAVALMLTADPTMCGTEMDYVLSQMAVELGPAYDEAEVTRLVQDMCADYTESEPTPTEEPAPEYAAFGQAYAWEDGLEATVTAPVEFTPAEYSAIADAAAHLMFTVTFTNNTTMEFDTALASVSMQSGGRESEQVYDAENNMLGAPSVTLLPGKSVSFDVGFGVLDPADLVLELAPSFEHSGAIFVS